MGNNEETNISGYEMLGNNKSEACCWARSASQLLWKKDNEKGFFFTDELKMKGGTIHGKEEGRQAHGMEMTCLEQPHK